MPSRNSFIIPSLNHGVWAKHIAATRLAQKSLLTLKLYRSVSRSWFTCRLGYHPRNDAFGRSYLAPSAVTKRQRLKYFFWTVACFLFYKERSFEIFFERPTEHLAVLNLRSQQKCRDNVETFLLQINVKHDLLDNGTYTRFNTYTNNLLRKTLHDDEENLCGEQDEAEAGSYQNWVGHNLCEH